MKLALLALVAIVGLIALGGIIAGPEPDQVYAALCTKHNLHYYSDPHPVCADENGRNGVSVSNFD